MNSVNPPMLGRENMGVDGVSPAMQLVKKKRHCIIGKLGGLAE